MHVMFLDDGVMARAISMGLCEQLTDSLGLAGPVSLPPLMKNRMAAGASTSA